MIHVDPAHPAFERLPRAQQAQIYHRYYGWTIEALKDEFGVVRDTAMRWINPEHRAMRNARNKAWRDSQSSKQEASHDAR